MDKELETFNYFVDDLLTKETNLLKHELDLLLIQHLFNSIDLEALNNLDIQQDFILAA
tara:strand:- start:357 stop:530 length:174 start_codon:yes stop_codon:yes gene_type:complete